MADANIQVVGVSSGTVGIDPTEITAEGGPTYPRLQIPLKMSFNPVGNASQGLSFTILAIECGLFLKDYLLRISDAIPITNLTTIGSAPTSTTWNLAFGLDPYRIKEVETRRQGDLKLRLDVAMVLSTYVRALLTDKQNQGHRDIVSGFQKPNCQIYVDIPRSHWVEKILPKLGARKYFIVELAVENEQTAPAWAHIEKAEIAFDQWDTKSVYAHCREAGDALAGLIEKHFGKDSFVRKERWGRVVEEFSHLSSLDLHLEDIRSRGGYSADEVKIDKRDAECLLIFTKALAKYAEELMRQ